MTKKIKKFILVVASIAISLWMVSTSNQTLAAWFGDMFGVSGIHTIWTEHKQKDSLIYTLQTAINWVLGILATITLCLVLYAGFLMLVSWWDSKKYDSWVNIIKHAAIWLAIIAVSWLIVSLIFYLINWSVASNIQTE